MRAVFIFTSPPRSARPAGPPREYTGVVYPEAPAREALATLCGLYWYPLYAFARRRGASPEEAQDLTQSFFAHLLEKEAIRHVDRERGRFRSFLLASFKNFQSDQREKQHARKRGGGQVPLPIDGEMAEGRYALEPSLDLSLGLAGRILIGYTSWRFTPPDRPEAG